MSKDKFDLFVLRRLYNPGQQGKGVEGKVSRAALHTTITPDTMLRLRKAVPVGRGQYAAPVVELSLRLMLAAVGSIDPDVVANEFVYAVSQREQVLENLERLLEAARARMEGAQEAVAALA